jgi:hypothetical protein
MRDETPREIRAMKTSELISLVLGHNIHGAAMALHMLERERDPEGAWPRLQRLASDELDARIPARER